jgi:diguanylate cyclase (GGDEF)-like protein
VIVLDIDNFKMINDRFGHATGDLTLQTIAAVCRIAKRDSDVVARIGGEEFAVMLPETDEEGARLFAERLCERVRASSSVIDGERVTVTVSIGIATNDADTTELLHLLGRADEALYEAKRAGRDRVVVSMSKAPALVSIVAV